MQVLLGIQIILVFEYLHSMPHDLHEQKSGNCQGRRVFFKDDFYSIIKNHIPFVQNL